MKRLLCVRFSLILAAGALFTAACEDLATTNQNANLAAANQNVNRAAENIQPSPAPTAVVPNNSAPEISPTPEASPSQSVSPPVLPEVNSAPKPIEIPAPNATPVQQILDAGGVAIDKLVIPVAGIKREQLQDTFTAARSSGRVHDAIDIMAAQNTPVVAAADGEIARFFDSARGGITIYQYSRDKKLIYYYAHLARRAEDLQEHAFVRQGTVIGYVGDTGDAGAGNFHLHFAIWTINDPKHFWDGTNLNPYPLLRQ